MSSYTLRTYQCRPRQALVVFVLLTSAQTTYSRVPFRQWWISTHQRREKQRHRRGLPSFRETKVEKLKVALSRSEECTHKLRPTSDKHVPFPRRTKNVRDFRPFSTCETVFPLGLFSLGEKSAAWKVKGLEYKGREKHKTVFIPCRINHCQCCNH